MVSTTRADGITWLPPEWADWSFPDPEVSSFFRVVKDYDGLWFDRLSPKVITEELKKEFTDEQRAKAWDDASGAVKTYHNELVEQWQKAMDSLLVYAGLFSAVLTAFNVQSYPLLQPGPTDPTLAVLQQISSQLNSFSVNPSFINSTQPARPPEQLLPPFRADVSAIWINTLWFISLVCSLASASIALIVKQWLFEESKGLSGTSRETARLRQYRLNSLIKWHVGVIVLVPSVLLQVALFLFLAGLLVLLWTIHLTVAAVVTVFIGALFAFVFVVTILPVFKLDCCYRSPQAYGMFVLIRLVWTGASRLAEGLSRQWAAVLKRVWSAIPLTRQGSTLSRLKEHVFTAHLHCSRWKMGQFSTWNGLEQTEVARDNGLLDRHIATMAYTTTLSTEHLKLLQIILSDLPCEQISPCFSELRRAWIRLWGADVDRCSETLTAILWRQHIYRGLRKMLTVDHTLRDSLSGDWPILSCGDFSSRLAAIQCLPRIADSVSTLALLCIGDSILAREAFYVLYRGYFPLNPDIPSFPITYDTVRNVMAMARYNAAHRVVRGGQYVGAAFIAVEFSLTWTRWALVNHVGLSWEQERWIRNETRTIISSLTQKATTLDVADWRDTFASRVVEPLQTLCQDISTGHDIIPEGFFLSASQVLVPRQDESPDEQRRGYFANLSFNSVKSAIRKLKHEENCAKRCIRSQQPPPMLF